MEPEEFAQKLKDSCAKCGLQLDKVEVVMTPGAQASSYLENEEFDKLEQYLVAYCNHNSLSLRDLFTGKGGGPNLNGDDVDSIPLQKAAIAMWNRWSDQQKTHSVALSVEKKGVSLDSLLTDECEQIREGAKLYADQKNND